MKYEWRKKEKDIYIPKEIPTVVKIPKMKYFSISGEGNPNDNPDFSARIEALYSIAYAVRMMPKNGYTPQGYFEYTVYPLEGIWDLTDRGKIEKIINKDEFIYTIMIRQPDFVTVEVMVKALEIINKKKPNPLYQEIKFEEIEDSLCVQLLHIGSYDEEYKSFEKMVKYMSDNNYERRNLTHREIYLSDFTKTDPQKLKTALRYFVKNKR